MRIECTDGAALAKRIVYLAWRACGGTFGMGALQDRGEQTEDHVWASAYNKTDYPGGRRFQSEPDNAQSVDCDYVQGRMMKFGVKWGADWAEVRCGNPRPDYQAWCLVYPTVAALVDAAKASLAS